MGEANDGAFAGVLLLLLLLRWSMVSLQGGRAV